MASHLRDRLARIQGIKKTESVKTGEKKTRDGIPVFSVPGWVPAGYQTVKRETYVASPLSGNKILPAALPVIIPDLRLRPLPAPTDFLFFDLETTGLSGGAGTIAFLAAFGRPEGDTLRVTQYLLLDYPGESDFLNAILGEFSNENTAVVTYNGKLFDAQILNNRCLMNGIRLLDFFHIDLLHPARRLWKRTIGSCSQSSIETNVLRLDRGDDIPGALAPEIWFDFLKTGNTDRLIGICAHNLSDISGLAAILSAMIEIIDNPLNGCNYCVDMERLALYWRGYIRSLDGHGLEFDNIKDTGKKLLRETVMKYPYGSFFYAKDCLREGDYDTGIKVLYDIAVSEFPDTVKALALRSLAIDSEYRLKDAAQALRYSQSALELALTYAQQNEFEHRVQRLERKVVIT